MIPCSFRKLALSMIMFFFVLNSFAVSFEKNCYPTFVVSSIMPDSSVHVYAVESWQNYLYIAYSKGNNYLIDVFDVHSVNQPRKIQSLDFGSASGSRIPFIPLSIVPRTDVLVVLANEQFYYYKQTVGGTLQFERQEPVTFLSESGIVSNLSISGEWGSMTQIVKGEFQHRLINFTNPRHPYFVRGADGQIPSSINEQIDGLPSVFYKNLQTGKLKIDGLNPVDFEHHYNAFWKDIVGKTFHESAQGRSIAELNKNVVDALNTHALMEDVLEIYRSSVQTKDFTVKEFILSKYDGNMPLQQVLDDRSISLNEPLAVVIRDVVTKSFNDRLNADVSKILFANSLVSWNQKVFAQTNGNDTVGELYKRIEAIASARYESSKIAEYLTDYLLGPLLNNPEFLSISLSELVNRIVASDFGEIIDATLVLGEYALAPFELIDMILSLTDVRKPSCANWPDNTRAFLEMILYKNKANLNPDGNAWYEFLKYYAYINNINFSNWEKEFDEAIVQIHKDVAKELVDRVSEAVRFTDNKSVTLDVAVQKYTNNIPSLAVIENAVAQSVLNEFMSLLMSGDVTVRDVLTQIQFPMAYSVSKQMYLPNGTLNQFLDLLGKQSMLFVTTEHNIEKVDVSKALNVNNYNNKILTTTIDEYISRGISYAPEVKVHVQKLVESYAFDAFGSNQLLMGDAIARSITSRMDLGGVITSKLGNLFGTMVTQKGTEFPFESLFYQVKDALDGDCFAFWDLFLTSADIALAILPGGLEYATILQAALHQSYEYSLEVITQMVLGEMVKQIFTDSGNDWNSWAVRFETKELYSQSAPLPEAGILFEAMMVNDNLVQMYYTRTTDFTNRKQLKMNVTSIKNGNRSTYDLGLWNNIDYAYADKGFAIVTGLTYAKESEIIPQGNAMLFDLRNTESIKYQYIVNDGNTGSLITAAQGFNVIAGGQYFAIKALDRVLILPNTFGVKLSVPGSTVELPLAKNMRVFPNPVKTYTQISGIPENAEIYVYDVAGNRIHSQKFRQENPTIDFRNFDSGYYLIRSGEQTFKILKE